MAVPAPPLEAVPEKAALVLAAPGALVTIAVPPLELAALAVPAVQSERAAPPVAAADMEGFSTHPVASVFQPAPPAVAVPDFLP